jgi:hypothetical protein
MDVDGGPREAQRCESIGRSPPDGPLVNYSREIRPFADNRFEERRPSLPGRPMLRAAAG